MIKQTYGLLLGRGSAVLWLVLIVFSIRILSLVLVPPFIGIANNGDFERLSVSCGIGYEYNAWDGEHYGKAFFNYVPNDFKRLDSCQDTGWRQIFAGVTKIAVALSNVPIGGHFDIRHIGIVNALVYIFLVSVLAHLIFRIGGVTSFVGVGVLLLISGDAYIIQYFNSFYTEIGSVFGLYLLIICWLLAMRSRVAKWPLCGICFMASVFAVNSKQQDILLMIPVVFGVYLLLGGVFHKRWHKWAVCAILTCAVIVTMPKNKRAPNMAAFNVILQDILHDSKKQEEHLALAGCDEKGQRELMSAIGENAFSCGFPWEKYKDATNRLLEINILCREPAILFRMVNRRAKSLFTMEDGLGNYTVDSGAQKRVKTVSNAIWTHIKNAMYRRTFGFWIAILAVALAYAIYRIKTDRTTNLKSPWWGLIILIVFNMLRFLTVIVGDSSHDDIKHFFALNVEFDIIVAIVLMGIIWQAEDTILHHRVKGRLMGN